MSHLALMTIFIDEPLSFRKWYTSCHFVSHCVFHVALAHLSQSLVTNKGSIVLLRLNVAKEVKCLVSNLSDI